MRSQAAARWAAGGAIAAALGLWLIDIGQPALWTDEAFSLRFASSFEAARNDPLHPPGYYTLLHTLFIATGDRLEPGRYLSVTCALAAIAIWYLLARRWEIAGRLPTGTALLAAALAVLSPHDLLYGRMIRYF